MLFHTWPFFVFLLVVLPVFFALRKTRLWLPWLSIASYFFYGWWNPYYLSLVMYSTILDFCLVALMDHCPPRGAGLEAGRSAWRVGLERLKSFQFNDRVLRLAFVICALATLGLLTLGIVGPK